MDESPADPPEKDDDDPSESAPENGQRTEPEPDGGADEGPAPQDAQPDDEDAEGGQQSEPDQSDESPPSHEPPVQATSPEEQPQSATDRLRALGMELDPVALRCVVSRVVPESVADVAGLHAGDVIVSVGGQETPHVADLAGLSEWNASTTSGGITMSVRRNGRLLGIVLRPSRD